MDNKCYILYDCSDSTTERGEKSGKMDGNKNRKKNLAGRLD